MDCTVIGDSIAVGIHAVMGCTMYAKVGLSSDAIVHATPKVHSPLVIISAGSNDPMNPELLRNLRRIRAKVTTDRLVWVMPYHRYAALAVQRVAHERGDDVVDLAFIPSRDNVHPRNYVNVAKKIRGEW